MRNSYESVYVNLLHIAAECLGKSYLTSKLNTNILTKEKKVELPWFNCMQFMKEHKVL